MKFLKKLKIELPYDLGFPSGSYSNESACNAGDLGSIPGSGRSPGEGNVNPLQYSCLENPMELHSRAMDKNMWTCEIKELPTLNSYTLSLDNASGIRKKYKS